MPRKKRFDGPVEKLTVELPIDQLCALKDRIYRTEETKAEVVSLGLTAVLGGKQIEPRPTAVPKSEQRYPHAQGARAWHEKLEEILSGGDPGPIVAVTSVIEQSLRIVRDLQPAARRSAGKSSKRAAG